MKTITHGTVSGYAHHRCRCDNCTRANSDYQRSRRHQRRRPVTPTPETEPIWIDCEGGGDTGHDVITGQMCRMCGTIFHEDHVPHHQRQDILAMIERGDFG